MTAQVIKPVSIAGSMLHNTSVGEPSAGETAWSPGATYAVGDRRIRSTTHRIYEARVAGVDAGLPEATPARWLDVGPTNAWAMFDDIVDTQTTASGSITAVVKPGYVNSLALVNIQGSQVAVTVRDGLAGPIVYDRSITLETAVIADWYQYFFEPTSQPGDLVLTDLPPYGNAHVTVVLSAAGEVALGGLILGTSYVLGETEFGATAGIIDFSRKETDEFGTTFLVRRRFSKRASWRLMLDNSQLNKEQQVLSSLRATPCVWIGSEIQMFGPLVVFGFYKDFSLEIAYPLESLCSIEIEGLT